MTLSDIEGVELRRLHPLTPVFKSWRLIAGAGAIGLGVLPRRARPARVGSGTPPTATSSSASWPRAR